MLAAAPYCQARDVVGGEEIAAQAARAFHALYRVDHLVSNRVVAGDDVVGDPFGGPFVDPGGQRLARLVAPVEAVSGFVDHHRGQVLGIVAGEARDQHGAVFAGMFQSLDAVHAGVIEDPLELAESSPRWRKR